MALKLYDKLTPSGDFPLIKAMDVEMADGSRLSEFKPGVDENTEERISKLEAQDELFAQAAQEALAQVESLSKQVESLDKELDNFNPGIDPDTEERISSLEASAESATANWLSSSLRLNALETPAVSVDLSAFDATGVITETHKSGYTSTYTLTFDENGNPTQIVEVRKKADGQVVAEYTTVLTW